MSSPLFLHGSEADELFFYPHFAPIDTDRGLETRKEEIHRRLPSPLAQQGKQPQARQMLAQIYGWFTEGLATADLQDAKALLDALA